MSKEYQFTTDWHSWCVPAWERLLADYKGRPNLLFLEIGCFQGRATIWLLENILTHESSRIHCIDAFRRWDEETRRNTEAHNVWDERRFEENIRIGGFERKVRKIRGFSQEELRKLPLYSYDFIYIDGSHIAGDVLEDAVLSFRLLKTHGIMIFDDYKYRTFLDELEVPKIAIDAFLKIYCRELVILERSPQIAVRKIAQRLPAI